jgi:DNA-binding NarL/FixJ family response regulator
MEKTTLCLIDDHKIVRQGLKELLEKLKSYQVTHEFENGTEFIAALPLENPPNLYILDYSMPGMTGLDVLQALAQLPDEYKVLLLTQHFDEDVINDAYHYGARGFLHKNCTAQELKFAIDNIVTIGYNNITEILKRIRNYNPVTNENAPKVTLSDREQHFLTLVCDEHEYTYDQMADIIGVSVKSIEAYRAALFERFDIKSKVGLVLFSFKHRLTPPFN